MGAQSQMAEVSQAQPAGSQQAEATAAPKLRILHVVNQLATGGTELAMLRVMKGLVPFGFEGQVCAIRGFDPELIASGRLEKEPFTGSTSEGRQFGMARLVKIMREYRPHVVHSRNWGAIEAIPAAKMAGVPVSIHSEHGYELDMLAGMPWRRRAMRRFAFQMADAVFTVTNDLREYHAKYSGFDPSRMRVLYNGVNTQQFFPRQSLRRELRQRLGLSDSSMVLGTVSRMVPLKSHETLLQAAEKMLAQGLNVQVLLVGSGPQRGVYEQYVKDSASLGDKVVFVDDSSDVAAMLNAMDVFVLCSRCEGMSNTILEAMASGLPVIATAVGGNVEVVDDNVTGFLFEPGDAAALGFRAGQLHASRDLYLAMAQAARKRAVEQFSLESMLNGYRDMYVELLQRKGISQNSERDQ
jgi:sugar transferase (PEP-CTERM/EpsH1 system associated)